MADLRLGHWGSFLPAGLGSISWGLAARLKSCPSRSWRCRIMRGMGSWNPMSRKRRETLRLRSGQAMGHPRFVVVSANSRFLTGLSARFGMTRFLAACGRAEVLPSIPLRGVLAASQSDYGIGHFHRPDQPNVTDDLADVLRIGVVGVVRLRDVRATGPAQYCWWKGWGE
jgi:hypothetical protein